MSTIKPTLAVLVAVLTFAPGCASKKKTYQRGVDDGYVIGHADEIKRQYWLKQAIEKHGKDAVAQEEKAKESKTVYYQFDGPTETEDGRRLVDNKVTVPVKE